MKNLRKEFKYAIGFLVIGFVSCFIIYMLSVAVFASEPDPEPENSETVLEVEASEPEIVDNEIVQYEQTESMAAASSESDLEPMSTDEPPSEPEQHPEAVQDAQNRESESSVEIQPFASGVIVGELADLLQENIIENDGYTDETWERYETAVADGWAVISNFMAYTNDEVRAVIDELQSAISGLEYPAGEKPDVAGLENFETFANEHFVATGFNYGLMSVLIFSGALRVAI